MKTINYRAMLDIDLSTYATKVTESQCREILLQFFDDMTKDELIEMIVPEFYVTGIYDD